MKILTSTNNNSSNLANKPQQKLAGDTAFFYKDKKVIFKGLLKKSVIEQFGKDFGQSAGKHFEEIINKADKLKNSGLDIEKNGRIKFTEQPFYKRALDILVYPVKDMPKDLVNASISGLRKIPFLKDNSWLSDLSAKPVFQKRRNAVENKSNVAAVKHYIELLERDKNGKGYSTRFAQGHTRIAPLMPTYNSEAERSLNRVVTGLIPAFFLANDAFNLSMYVNNDKEAAKKEKKRRFKQELTRIGITVAATFYLMSIFAKQCNKNIKLTAGLTAGMVLFSETISRLISGNPVLPVSAEKAKEYAQKRKNKEQNTTFKPAKQKNTENKTVKKGFLTINNILKVLGGLVAFGFAAEKVSNIPKINKKLVKFNDWYKGLFTEEYKIERKHFNELMDKLRENKFNEMADYYEKMVKDQKGKTLKIGHIQNKKKHILIHQILAFPVRFVKDVALFPYKNVIKPLSNMVKEKLNIKNAPKNLTPSVFDDSKDILMLRDSLRFLEKIKNDEKFASKVNKKLVSSFDNLTKSSYKNSDLGVIVKTAQSTVTTGFLIADNYNLVMIDSQGKDKDLAEEKAKERAMQRGARLTYEAFILKMVNDIFAGPYNTSLLAALSIAGGLRVITEGVERTAVGLPLHESTKEEIQATEREHLSATGLKGSYFRTMAKLAGKKSLSERKTDNK